MALREIIVVGSQDEQLLREKCREVTSFDKRLHTLLDDMADTMRFEGRGVGLAAPQIGICRRIFVADVGDGTGLHEFINPKVTPTGENIPSEEGCLSLPGQQVTIMRPSRVTVEAQDRHGNPFTLEADDFLAICISHENDHLDGILCSDRRIGDQTT